MPYRDVVGTSYASLAATFVNSLGKSCLSLAPLFLLSPKSFAAQIFSGTPVKPVTVQFGYL